MNDFRRRFTGPPLVSVILPTFNRAGSLLRAIESVLAQTYREFELILVDDGSSDDTPAIAASVKDARVSYIRLAKNQGQSAARNVGISKSKGSLIAFQDSDDTWQSDKLERQVKVLYENPYLAGVYCDLRRVNAAGATSFMQAPNLVRGATFDHRPSLYQTFGIGIQSCVIRKQALESVGLFHTEMRCFDDLELLLRLTKKYDLRRIPGPLVNYHEAGGVTTNVKAASCDRVVLFRRYGYRAAFVNPEAWFNELSFYLWQTGRSSKVVKGGLGDRGFAIVGQS
jgi:glycosyltransferase involved in cell wall biosynthesis